MTSRSAPRILIVDDDQMARETLEALLRREGYSLLFAASGAEVLRNIAALNPDLLLLDIMMPGMTGIELCQQLKQSPDYRHIPIIFVTALDTSSDLVHALDAGADEFISKPFHSMELKARIRSVLRIKKQYDELQYALQTRDLLSNMIVHDMRNPLAAVMLYVQLLKRRGNMQPDQNRYLDMIFTEAHHVSSFLEDMLLLNKLDKTHVPLVLAPLDLRRFASELREKTEPIVATRQVTLEIGPLPETPHKFQVDLLLFQRAVENLLNWVIKSAPLQSVVSLRFYVDHNASPVCLRIITENSSPHLSAEELVHIFDKFGVMTLKEQGRTPLGLGLAYCHKVIAAHGGRVVVHNLESIGLQFVIDLPQAP